MKKYALLPLLFLAACNSGTEVTTTRVSEPFAAVLEYTPAPGQFINEAKSGFEGVTTAEAACAYTEKRMTKGSYVSLGGWGGYIVARFAQPVPASTNGEYDLWVKGNTMGVNTAEPGVVWVMQDTNGDGQPNDTWYELRGSEDKESVRGYRITYTRPAGDKEPIAWTDDNGGSGTIGRMDEFQHTQPSYYPAWIDTPTLSFEGTLLPSNVLEGTLEGQPGWLLTPFEWGYADNLSQIDAVGQVNRFRIADAVTASGEGARLTQIDFIKVQTGINEWRPAIGEISTEVSGIGCYRTRQSSNE